MSLPLSKPRLLKTQLSILITQGLNIESSLEDIQSKVSDVFNCFYLIDELEEEILDIIGNNKQENIVLIPENY